MSKLQKKRGGPPQKVGDTGFFLTDGFYNSQTGVGSGRNQAITFCPEFFVSEQELSDLVDCNWLARRVVRALPEAAHQDEILWESDKDRDTWDKINTLEGNDDGALLTADVWARTHGCSLLILGQDYSGGLEKPFGEGTPIEWLEPVASYDFHVGATDLNNDKENVRRFGKPEYYTISGRHRLNGQKIHHSRAIHFSGPTLSDPDHSRDWRKMQQLSVLDPVYSLISGYALTWSAFETMIQQGAVPIWTLKGLISGLSKSSDLVDRLKLQQEMVSVVNAIFLDAGAGETYERKAVSLADVPETMKQLAIQLCAGVDIPVSELFGKLISGLGDKGEAEDQKWLRKIDRHRNLTLGPRMKKIMPGAVFKWKPVSVPTPLEKAEIFGKWWSFGQVTTQEARDATEGALELPNLTPQGKAELERLNARTSIDPYATAGGPGASESAEADPDTDEGA